ncbi:preprotein translocase subunit YajC [Parasphaerochaeta coccoides]|uniref:Sec translocon accessory complex subunit YajC n=1 Tax=Parasphaerochaeta coccoides (strain ATCC BAA-1237 / DSM 17374 / SPN1) TaxID=760011 RepID=F4GKN9_PARC1|nr:preprotein translocase subunit YajC [Parasphaerochaeta coccoides]AEC01448.1 preprotein translocase, YajC subunit [Parasphaerochaeta coccoides DSM 17374]
MHALIAALGASGASGSPSGGSSIPTLVTFGLVAFIFYFMIIRPQRKRDKEAKNMIAAIKKGDRVVTIGGIYGTIVTVKENTVVLKVDDNARLEFAKSAISSVVNKKVEPVSEAKESKETKGKETFKKKDEAEDAVIVEDKAPAPAADDVQTAETADATKTK